jgi:hypothetical protein
MAAQESVDAGRRTAGWRARLGPHRANTAVLVLALVALGVDLLVAHGGTEPIALVVPVSFLVVGWLVLRRYPEHVEGRLLLGVGLAWALTIDLWLPGAWVVPLGLMGTHLLLRYPDGQLPSPRWQRFATTCTWLVVVVAVLVTLAASSTPDGRANPLFVRWLQPLAVLPVLLVGAIVVSVGSIVVRYRRSTDRTRAQIRWLAVAAVGVVLVYALAIVVSLVYDAVHQVDSLQANWFDRHYPVWVLSLQVGAFLSFLLVPAAFGVAILRYRLYEIDRIISRTTAYALVTGLLVAVFTAVVVGAARVVGTASNTAVAAATLVTAALARPLLRRVQTAVDRRFNRERYDARRVVESFGARLRHDVASEQVAQELQELVAGALQPSLVGLWVRGGPRKT